MTTSVVFAIFLYRCVRSLLLRCYYSIAANNSVANPHPNIPTEMMLYACLEQLLVHGSRVAEVVLKAFAWGPGPCVRSDGAEQTSWQL